MEEQTGRQEPDWRHQAASTLAQPFTDPTGYVFPIGANVTLQAITRWKKGQLLALHLPNATAMMLDTSRMSFMRSEKLLGDVQKLDTQNGVTVMRHDTDSFDFIEDRASSVVFALCALEAFANEMLPDNYTYTADRNDGRCMETYSRSQIERFLSLDTKLGDMLPAVLFCPSPRGGKTWDSYCRLRDLRDRVIHMKADDRKNTDPDDDTVWGALVRIPAPHVTAKAVIDHFVEKQQNKPRWVTRFPE
jgi:hypothetical protein